MGTSNLILILDSQILFTYFYLLKIFSSFWQDTYYQNSILYFLSEKIENVKTVAKLLWRTFQDILIRAAQISQQFTGETKLNFDKFIKYKISNNHLHFWWLFFFFLNYLRSTICLNYKRNRILYKIVFDFHITASVTKCL